MSTKDVAVRDKDTAMMTLFKGANINFRKYRSFDLLPKIAWEYIDDVVVRTAKEELNGITDLNSNPNTNITFDGMSASVYTKRRISEMSAAYMGMSPEAGGEAGRLDETNISIPLPVTYKDFWLNTKQVAMAARIGYPIDVTHIEEATRSVVRKLEDTLFNGEFPDGGSTLYGYTKFPDRVPYTIPESWTAVGKTPDEIFADVNAMVNLSMTNNHYGPWIIYIPWQYQIVLNKDYYIGDTYTVADGTIYDRLLKIPGVQAIKMTHSLAADNVVMVEMTSGTIQLINGIPIRAMAWEPPGSPSWDHKFKVMGMAAPMCLSDYNGQCGIVHGSISS